MGQGALGPDLSFPQVSLVGYLYPPNLMKSTTTPKSYVLSWGSQPWLLTLLLFPGHGVGEGDTEPGNFPY